MLSKRLRLSSLIAITIAFAACSDRAVSSSSPATRLIDTALQPQLGALVTSEEPPPPISGGTLALSRTEPVAVAADSDRDRVYIVDLELRAVRFSVQLPPKSEPGRIALDDEGRAHVALRRSNQLATIDLATGTFFLRPTCIAPRGVAHDSWRGTVLVACASGDIEVHPPGGGARKALWPRAGVDLRDIIVREDSIHVTEFRRAKVDTFTPDGQPLATRPFSEISHVAWRSTTFDASDTARTDVVVTQDESTSPVSIEQGGYGSGTGSRDVSCEPTGIVSTKVWIVDQDCATTSSSRLDSCAGSFVLPTAVLPVDVAANGREVAVVAAGNAYTKALSQVFVLPLNERFTSACPGDVRGQVEGQAIALGFDSLDELIVQTREPARLHIMTEDRQRTYKTIELSTLSRADTGHQVFHANAGGNIACASCHAEGGDDAHTWDFDGIGPRRTPSLLGTTNHTEPYHWDGDMKDLSAIVEHVFQQRMSGPKLDAAQTGALSAYMSALPAPQKLRRDEDVPQRGRVLFEERCASCHAGPMTTNNLSVDVGYGRFQVPSLVGVAWRGPWLHDGCAKTLFDRFDPRCGGAKHGDLTGVSLEAQADIVAFMESL